MAAYVKARTRTHMEGLMFGFMRRKQTFSTEVKGYKCTVCSRINDQPPKPWESECVFCVLYATGNYKWPKHYTPEGARNGVYAVVVVAHKCMVCGALNDKPVVPRDPPYENLLSCMCCQGCSPPDWSPDPEIPPEGREYYDGKVHDGARVYTFDASHLGEILGIIDDGLTSEAAIEKVNKQFGG